MRAAFDTALTAGRLEAERPELGRHQRCHGSFVAGWIDWRRADEFCEERDHADIVDEMRWCAARAVRIYAQLMIDLLGDAT